MQSLRHIGEINRFNNINNANECAHFITLHLIKVQHVLYVCPRASKSRSLFTLTVGMVAADDHRSLTLFGSGGSSVTPHSFKIKAPIEQHRKKYKSQLGT